MVMKAVKASRVWTIPVVLALGLVYLQALVAVAQGDLRTGTWELNLGKSTLSPGPPPRGLTLRFQALGRQRQALGTVGEGRGNPISPGRNGLASPTDGRVRATTLRAYD